MSDNESETTATSHRDARQRDVWRGSAWHCTSRHAGPNQPHFSRQNLTAASRWRWQIAKIFGRPEIANISEDGACVAGYIICVGECRVRVVQNMGGVRPGVMILIVSTCLCYVGNQFWLHWDDSPPPALPACLLTSVGARVHWTWLGPATADTSKQIQLWSKQQIELHSCYQRAFRCMEYRPRIPHCNCFVILIWQTRFTEIAVSRKL